MRTQLAILALPAALLLFPACAAKGTPAERSEPTQAHAAAEPATVSTTDADFDWRGTIANGKTVRVQNINGPIRVTPSSAGEVTISAVKRVERGDGDRVRIELLEHDDGVTVCALYPDMTIAADGCSGSSSDSGGIKVEFEVTVPASAKFVGRTVNGSVKAERLAGEVEAYTVNGSVAIGARGKAQAKAVNGSIRVALVDMDGTEPLSFETVNGSIVLELPGATNAELRASTVHGKIKSDFGLPVESGLGPGASMRGQVGSGGRSIKLATVNGSIKVQRGDS